MKNPLLESIVPIHNSSFFLAHNTIDNLRFQDYWHFHPEYEIAYIPYGMGKRFIGDRITEYADGDFTVLGPKIPHNTYYPGFESKNYEEYVIQFGSNEIEYLCKSFPEFISIGQFLKKSQRGLFLADDIKHEYGHYIKDLFRYEGFDRLIKLMVFLRDLAALDCWKSLEAAPYDINSQVHFERIRKVFDVINQRYMENVSTSEIAEMFGLTNSSFCRFFKKSTGKSFKQAIVDVRIKRACELLSSSDTQIGKIALDVGFSNHSLFNKFFKVTIGESPSSYRKRFSDG
ncbi:MAG: AraC family transcriptional regulator [Bacteroidota bacterium]